MRTSVLESDRSTGQALCCILPVAPPDAGRFLPGLARGWLAGLGHLLGEGAVAGQRNQQPHPRRRRRLMVHRDNLQLAQR